MPAHHWLEQAAHRIVSLLSFFLDAYSWKTPCQDCSHSSHYYYIVSDQLSSSVIKYWLERQDRVIRCTMFICLSAVEADYRSHHRTLWIICRRLILASFSPAQNVVLWICSNCRIFTRPVGVHYPSDIIGCSDRILCAGSVFCIYRIRKTVVQVLQSGHKVKVFHEWFSITSNSGTMVVRAVLQQLRNIPWLRFPSISLVFSCLCAFIHSFSFCQNRSFSKIVLVCICIPLTLSSRNSVWQEDLLLAKIFGWWRQALR